MYCSLKVEKILALVFRAAKHPAYLTYTQSTSWKMLCWMSYKLEPRLWGEISTTQICRWYHCNVRKQTGTKEPLDEGEGGEWKSQLKPKLMASGPITSWQIEGRKMEAVKNFLFLGSKITVDGDRSHEIRRQFLLGRKWKWKWSLSVMSDSLRPHGL